MTTRPQQLAEPPKPWTTGIYRLSGIGADGKAYASEDDARKAAQRAANRHQRNVRVVWNNWSGTQRAAVATVAPNRKPRQQAA